MSLNLWSRARFLLPRSRNTITMKPVINLDELEMQAHGSAEARFQGSFGVVSDLIGAKKLGYNLSVIPPGKSVCPFHNHHNNEEMFLILEGEGVLRFGDQEFPLRKYDVVACPPGGREVAHQIRNTGDQDMKFLAVSTRDPVEVVEYPDSDKVGLAVGDFPNMNLKLFFPASAAVAYHHGEG